MAFNEYEPGSAFPAVIGRTTDESSPAWPQPGRATAGAPNVLVIDTGFGQLGCYTYMVGKWHLMPSEQESAAGPYDRRPLGRGFDRFYGFLGGDTSQSVRTGAPSIR
jgi:hypothetical protein